MCVVMLPSMAAAIASGRVTALTTMMVNLIILYLVKFTSNHNDHLTTMINHLTTMMVNDGQSNHLVSGKVYIKQLSQQRIEKVSYSVRRSLPKKILHFD